ncbi:hypothetical protein ABT369_36615 [Dactylosporangium sp. NPDC000244]|uniref:hypothetical protein n=1 Tax=Dactylosporangium sp. NPDC000244 TaxID=3154365 RepID=UPI003325944F
MRNAQRILALGAMTLTAGAVLGMTATAASASTEAGRQATAAKPGPHDHDGDRNGNWNGRRDPVRTWIAGRYNTKKTCQFFAWVGEQRGRFDDGTCVPAFNGRRGGSWLLIAKDYGHRGHR